MGPNPDRRESDFRLTPVPGRLAPRQRPRPAWPRPTLSRTGRVRHPGPAPPRRANGRPPRSALGIARQLLFELGNVKDVTVYTFLIPILGGDSPDKAKAIWCAKDSTAAWRNWMVDGTTPPKLLGDCATPLDRNVELSRKHRVNGTPAIVFENGVRVPGMLTADQLEKQLASNTKG